MSRPLPTLPRDYSSFLEAGDVILEVVGSRAANGSPGLVTILATQGDDRSIRAVLTGSEAALLAALLADAAAAIEAAP